VIICYFKSQDIVSLLEDQLRPLVQSEFSVLGDVLYRPEFMFPRQSEAWHKSKSGGFVSRYRSQTQNISSSGYVSCLTFHLSVEK